LLLAITAASGCEVEMAPEPQPEPAPWPEVEAVGELTPKPPAASPPFAAGKYALTWTRLEGSCTSQMLAADHLYLQAAAAPAVFVTEACDAPWRATSLTIADGSVHLGGVTLRGCDGTAIRVGPAELLFAGPRFASEVEVDQPYADGCAGTFILRGLHVASN
jgi:hypothetical protein